MPKLLITALLISLLGRVAPVAGSENPCPEPPGYELLRVIEVEGRQGVATDGERYFVSGNSSLVCLQQIRRAAQKNEAALEDLPRAGNHIGDIDVHNGEIYAGVEWFEDGQGKDIQVAVYDAVHPPLKRTIPWEPASGQVEVSGVAIDASDNSIWLSDWVNGRYLYRYDLDTVPTQRDCTCARRRSGSRGGLARWLFVSHCG